MHMTPLDQLPQELQTIVGLLRMKPHSVRDLCNVLSVSKPTAYSRIKELEESGYVMTITKRRDGVTGPEASVYALPAALAP